MKIRPAKISDAQGICDLVNHYAEQDLMLHRSLESIYDCLREFIVAVEPGLAADENEKLLGCVAVDIFWGNCAEIRSLAVAQEAKGLGVGKALISACLADARRLGVPKLFAMTYEQEFFHKLGFVEVDIETLPEKVCRECLAWYNQGHRHETAMVIEVEGAK